MADVRISGHTIEGTERQELLKAVILDRCYYDFRTGSYALGGVTTYLRNLTPVLAAAGFGPHFIFDNGCEHDEVLDGAHLHSVVANPKHFVESLIERSEKLFNPEEDLLIFSTSTFIRPSNFKKTLAVQHGIYWDVTTIAGRTLAGRLASTTARAIQAKKLLDDHALVSNMVCVDLNYVNWMRALSVSNRLPYTYIPNFADTAIPVPARKDDGVVRIVFARRFEEIRGCRLLIDVMPRILREHPEVELTIAGGGSLEAELHKAFEGTPRVSFTRYDANESIAFHGQFDIAMVPTVGSEGTSLSLLEAMAAGCAVVCTDVGGMSNIVLSGHNGMLVRPETEDLYEAVNVLIDDADMRARLSRNARQTVEDSFSRERWAEGWTRVLSDFIDGREAGQ